LTPGARSQICCGSSPERDSLLAYIRTTRQKRRRLRQHRQHRLQLRASAAQSSTGLTVCSLLLLMRIILVPPRPFLENVTSMPRVRRNICARRSRPASARGVFGQAAPLFQSSSLAKSAARKRSAGKRPPADVGTRSLRLTDMKAGICIRTVSIVSGCDTDRPHRVPTD